MRIQWRALGKRHPIGTCAKDKAITLGTGEVNIGSVNRMQKTKEKAIVISIRATISKRRP